MASNLPTWIELKNLARRHQPVIGAVPFGARCAFEGLTDNYAIYNISDLLPRHPTKEYKRRRIDSIRRVYIHHTGATNPARVGFRAVYHTGIYITLGRKWPGFPYTFYIPRVPDVDRRGRFAIYRCQRDSVRSYHTGWAANTHGVSIALEGNTNKEDLTDDQKGCLEHLLEQLPGMYPHLSSNEPISTHRRSWRFGGKAKRACPGKNAEKWLVENRNVLRDVR